MYMFCNFIYIIILWFIEYFVFVSMWWSSFEDFMASAGHNILYRKCLVHVTHLIWWTCRTLCFLFVNAAFILVAAVEPSAVSSSDLFPFSKNLSSNLLFTLFLLKLVQEQKKKKKSQAKLHGWKWLIFKIKHHASNGNRKKKKIKIKLFSFHAAW